MDYRDEVRRLKALLSTGSPATHVFQGASAIVSPQIWKIKLPSASCVT